MGEYHAYGTSLGCISRRLFVMWFCYVMIVIILVHIFRWFAETTAVEKVFGLEVAPARRSCLGLQCYEVFTCYGMRAASYHVREPLCSITGLVFFPIGAIACHHGYRSRLQILAYYLIGYAALQTGCVIADLIYIPTCDAYSLSVVEGTLLSMFSRVTPAAKAELESMNYYPKGLVDNVTDGYETVWFYCIRYGLWAAFLVYTAHEALMLGMLAERGPLGVGVHCGIDQWDETLSKDAIMHRKAREVPSPFIQDAVIPPLKDVESPFGYFAGLGDYGSLTHTQKKMMGKMVGQGASLDEWSSHRRIHHASPDVIPKYAEHYRRAEGFIERIIDEEDENDDAFRSELDIGGITTARDETPAEEVRPASRPGPPSFSPAPAPAPAPAPPQRQQDDIVVPMASAAGMSVPPASAPTVSQANISGGVSLMTTNNVPGPDEDNNPFRITSPVSSTRQA